MAKKRQLTGSKAMAEAISLEMKNNEEVFVIGEDIGKYGGIFGSTTGLLEQFGPERIIDTPISETAIIGTAIGAATAGMRPIVEIMFVDFIGVGFDQIYNQMAKIPYMSGGNVKVPMVLMTAVGGGYNDAAQHSQTLYATLGHLPGMKVVAPTTPYDLKGMMASAIQDDNPVIFMFHKTLQGLGWMDQLDISVGEVPEEHYTVPLDKAKVMKEGTDITILSLQMTTLYGLEAVKELEDLGISVELIDLRSIVPIDKETIVNSAKKTGRVIVVDEDYKSFGITAEVAAILQEEAFDSLKKPVKRIAEPDVPIPYSRPLENFVLPNTEDIVAAAKELVDK